MMPGLIENKYIALGVSGSIACHKSVDLASKLVQDGAFVDVILTESALNFVTPMAFEAITHRPVTTGLFDSSSDSTINHVSIADRSDVFVLAPATANIIAKISLGLADDPLTTTVLATNAPVIVCPAMDGHMYENPATQENINRLIQIQELTNKGMNLEGIKVIYELKSTIDGLQEKIDSLEKEVEEVKNISKRREGDIHKSYKHEIVIRESSSVPRKKN